MNRLVASEEYLSHYRAGGSGDTVVHGGTAANTTARKIVTWRLWLAVIAVHTFVSAGITVAVPACPHPFTVKQPDGTSLTLYIRGDEYFHWLEDTRGFTVVRENNTYRYATLDDTQQLTPTRWRVGDVDPAQVGLSPKTLPPSSVRLRLRQEHKQAFAAEHASAAMTAGVTGTRKNIVIMMRFADHLTRPLPSNADIDTLFNAVGGDPVLAPTGSVRDVYLENSYGQFSLDSTVVGWVDLPQTESYYANGASGLSSRFWSAIRSALQAADSSIDFSQFDVDGNGFVDSIAFIHSGYGAEWGGMNSPNRIWSHRWSIPSWTSNEGVRVSAYHVSPGLWGPGGSTEIGRIGVICHETGHFFGLPDLYDTSGNGAGLGSYGMMGNSWGFDGSQLHPPHFSPHSKIALGWVTPTVIGPGTYSAAQVEFSPEVFRIDIGFSNNEYLLIENRQPVGVESIMPQGGLCIWHIDEAKCCNTDEGYPGQAGWPENNRHYRVALLQADGNYDLERDNNRGDGGDVYHLDGVRSITTTSVPSTDRYQFGVASDSGVIINGISAAGSVMDFTFVGAPPVSAAPTTETNDTLRYLRFAAPPPTPSGVNEIIRVTVTALDGFNVPVNNEYYVGPPVAAPEEDSSQPGLTFTAAPLQCDPYIHNWSSEGIISVYGAEIMPSSSYVVQRASVLCPDLAMESCWSDPLVITTAFFGDVVGPYSPTPFQPDFKDIQAYVAKFLGNPGAPIKSVAQLQPNVVSPMNAVDFKDIATVVQAFLGTSYASVNSILGPCTCPSNIICGNNACANDVQCGTGFCIDGFCTDRCGRCTP